MYVLFFEFPNFRFPFSPFPPSTFLLLNLFTLGVSVFLLYFSASQSSTYILYIPHIPCIPYIQITSTISKYIGAIMIFDFLNKNIEEEEKRRKKSPY